MATVEPLSIPSDLPAEAAAGAAYQSLTKVGELSADTLTTRLLATNLLRSTGLLLMHEALETYNASMTSQAGLDMEQDGFTYTPRIKELRWLTSMDQAAPNALCEHADARHKKPWSTVTFRGTFCGASFADRVFTKGTVVPTKVKTARLAEFEVASLDDWAFYLASAFSSLAESHSDDSRNLTTFEVVTIQANANPALTTCPYNTLLANTLVEYVLEFKVVFRIVFPTDDSERAGAKKPRTEARVPVAAPAPAPVPPASASAASASSEAATETKPTIPVLAKPPSVSEVLEETRKARLQRLGMTQEQLVDLLWKRAEAEDAKKEAEAAAAVQRYKALVEEESEGEIGQM